MDFRITGLSPGPFQHLLGLSDAALAAAGARRAVADQSPGYPDRIELRDVAPGERVILVNHVHQPADTPYRASHAVFVREGALIAYDRVNEVPSVLRIRPISLRAFDGQHMMVDADLAEGEAVEATIRRLLGGPDTAYIQAHFARRGCYACRITRA